MRRLGVNIDHIATLRNARGELHPDPIFASKFVKKAGADSITIHLREDRRHIKDNDAKKICSLKKILVNLEISTNPKMISKALKIWIKSQCEEIGEIDLEIKGSLLRLIEGSIDKVNLKADDITFQGLSINYIKITTNKIGFKFNLSNSLQRININEKFLITAEMKLTEKNLNQSIINGKFNYLIKILGNELIGYENIKLIKIKDNIIQLVGSKNNESSDSSEVHLANGMFSFCLDWK